jgi:hypothetical protein
MSTGNGFSSHKYTVAFPKPLLDQLRTWADEAERLGVSAEFLSVIREVNLRLKTDPTKWGDPLRDYQAIDAAELRGMIPKWLLVWYGVDDRARQVIVRRLLPAPGSPLSPPPT